MIVTLISISTLLAISTAYLAYTLKNTKSRLQDYVAKYESVKVYAEGVAKQVVAVPVTTTKRKTTKKIATPVPNSTPAKRGRKPKSK